MISGQLHSRVVRLVDSPDGKQADIMLIEPNGDEHPVRCLCKPDGTMDLGGDGEVLAYLNHRYSPAVVGQTARAAILRS